MKIRNRKVVAMIRCGDRTCAPCGCQSLRDQVDRIRWCWMFACEIRLCKDNAFHRCRACLAAERAEREGRG